MILSHYNGSAEWAFEARGYVQDDPFGDTIGKPVGLWLSIDGPDDWPSWCSSESHGVERLAYRHAFEMTEPERVLHLSNPGAVEGLSERFPVIGQREYSFAMISWRDIAREYAGIIIAPYQWQCRLEHRTRWYYSWDCASGCVWDLSAIRYVGSEPFDVGAYIKRIEAEAEHAV